MRAADFLDADVTSRPPEPGPAATPRVRVPTTVYSLGQDVGGPDEMQDKWTNKGYSSKGRNLTPGVVAVNDSRFPLGTVFRDPETGLAFLATDRHGNDDPNVVDFFEAPSMYKPRKENRVLEVVGKVDEIPRTVEGVRQVLSKFGSVPPGESGVEFLEGRSASSSQPQQSAEAFLDEAMPPSPAPPAPNAQPSFTSGAAVSASAFLDEPVSESDFLDANPEPATFTDTAQEWINQFARGATSDGGIFAMTEGASRAISNSIRTNQPEATKQPDGSYGTDWLASLRNSLADTLDQYADDVAGTRRDVRSALPVSQDFQQSLPGQIVAGFGQLPASLAAYSIPGLGPLTSLGGIYDETYQQALEATGGDVARAHDAGVKAMPAGVLDMVMDKTIIGKVLKPLKGKITVGDLAKTFAVTGAAGGTTEAAQQTWQNFVAKTLSGYDPDRKLDDDVVNSFLVGAIVDSTVSTAGQAVVARTPQAAAVAGGPQGLREVRAFAPEGPTDADIADTFGAEFAPPPTAEAERGTDVPRETMPAGTAEQFAPPPQPTPPVVTTQDRNAGWSRPPAAVAPRADRLPPVQSPEVAAVFAATRRTAAEQAAAAEEARLRAEMERDLREAQAEGNYELIEALERVGGLPARQSRFANDFAGELDRVRTAARSKVNQGGAAFMGRVFRADAKPLDQTRRELEEYGFFFATPAEMVDAIEQRLTTGRREYGSPNVPFSKAAPPPPADQAQVNAVADQAARAMAPMFARSRTTAAMPQVVVVPDAAAIADPMLRSTVLAEDAKGRGMVDAFYHDGTIYLMANRLTPEQAARKVRHEALHHVRRTDAAVAAEFERLKLSFSGSMDAKTRAELTALYGSDESVLVEEYLARLAEDDAKGSVYRRFISKVKAMLARVMPGVQFTEDDAREFVRRALRGRKMKGPMAAGTQSKAESGSRAQPVVATAPRMEFGNASIVGPTMFSISAYHGTPHKVDRFSLDKIGTGEGAQAYGWGLYFANRRDVAQEYQRNLAALSWKTQDDGTEEARRAKSMLAYYKTKDAAIRQVQSDLQDGYLQQQEADRLRFHIETASGTETGNLYTVELDVKPEDLLDWDKPLSDQSEKVKSALDKKYGKGRWNRQHSGAGTEFGGQPFREITQDTLGSQFYHFYASDEMDPQQVSEMLMELGIPGIRFLDQQSRSENSFRVRGMQNIGYSVVRESNGETVATYSTLEDAQWDADRRNARRTYNYVIFDESKIKIVAENDVPVNLPEFKSSPAGFAFSKQAGVDATGQIDNTAAMPEDNRAAESDGQHSPVGRVAEEYKRIENDGKPGRIVFDPAPEIRPQGMNRGVFAEWKATPFKLLPGTGRYRKSLRFATEQAAREYLSAIAPDEIEMRVLRNQTARAAVEEMLSDLGVKFYANEASTGSYYIRPQGIPGVREIRISNHARLKYTGGSNRRGEWDISNDMGVGNRHKVANLISRLKEKAQSAESASTAASNEKGGSVIDRGENDATGEFVNPESPALSSGAVFSKQAAEDAATSPAKRRRFIDSVKAAQSVAPEVKDRVESIYQPITNKATVEAAADRINTIGIDAALVDVLTAPTSTAMINTMAIDLMGRLQAANRMDDAASVAIRTAERATSQGQAIQALALMARLTPQGIDVYAERVVRAAAAKSPRLAELQAEIDRLREEIRQLRKPQATAGIVDAGKSDAAKVVKTKVRGKQSGANADAETAATMQRVNLRMRDILMMGQADKAAVLKQLQDAILAETGVTNAEAAALAKQVQASFERKLKEARESLLKQMQAIRGPAAPPRSELDKIMRLNNAGALDDARFFAALAKAYGLPVWSPDLSARVQALIKEYEGTTDALRRLYLGAKVMDTIHEAIPADAWAKARSLQNMAMLLNVKTMIRNVLGNVVLWVPNLAADAISMPADALVSVVTGKRTRRSLDVADRLAGLTQPVQDFWNGYSTARAQGQTVRGAFAAGVDELVTLARLVSGGKYNEAQLNEGTRRTFNSGVLRMLEDALGVGLGAFDRAFHQSAYRASLARQMRVAEREGRAMLGPDAAMVEEAMMDAAVAIFQDDNAVSRTIGGIRKLLNLNKEFGLGSIVMPFAQVPGSILVRGAEWSPLGFIRLAYELIRPVVRRDNFRQKDFVDAFSRASLGTGIVLTGYWLAKIGVLSALPEEDEDLEAMRRASGLGAYRINVTALKRAMLSTNWWTPQTAQAGDVVVNYDWVQPLAIPLAMGGQLAHEEQTAKHDILRGKKSALPASKLMHYLDRSQFAAGAGLRTMEELSLLQSITRVMRGAGQDGLAGASAEVLIGAPTNFVPTVVNQVNQLMDNQVRELRAGGAVEEATNRFLSRIPGAASKLAPKYDVFGQAQERYQYGGNSLFNVMINPAFVTRVRDLPAAREVDAVFAATGRTDIVPRRANPTVQIANQRIQLTNEQISEYQRLVGTATLRGFTALAASPRFAQLNNATKAEIMARVIGVAGEGAKLQLFAGDPALTEEVRSAIRARMQAQQDAGLIPDVPK